MSWRKHFSPVKTQNNPDGSYSPFTNSRNGKPSLGGPASSNYSSYLPDVYVGSPNRVERYSQYDNMDMDSEVNAALDILGEFCTQKNKQNNTPFTVEYKSDATNSEITIIRKYLQQWCKMQEFETKMFRILRNVFKYGDQFFIRDPETKVWYHVDPANVTRIIVNESSGKEPEQYMVKNINFNFVEGVATTPYETNGGLGGAGTTSYTPTGSPGSMTGQPQQSSSGSRFQTDLNEWTIDAKHMVHLSLSEGMDNNFPFGNSLLETIFKVYKQKELLEDAIIIYRVQRAPERRVFYVDVGNMPSHLAMQFVERVKTEIHQRRIPSATGGGQNVIDSSYNPLCLDLETKIPLLDGRTLTLNNLIEEFDQGKENWAYSCNPETGEVVPGVINWAGVTRKNTEVIKLTLDNGETLICTPDHKIPVFGKGFVEAKDIKSTDSLISFEKQNQKISHNSKEYEQVWDHPTKTWKWTHRTVGEFFRKINKHQEFTFLEENIGKEKTVIHHKDYDRFNNDPRNLQYMNKTDHILYHSSLKEDYWKNLSSTEKEILSDKISGTLKLYWKNMSDIERQSALYNIRKAQKKSVWMRQNDPITKASYSKNQSISRKKYINENPKFKEMLDNNLENRVKIKNQELNLTFEMLQIVVDIVKNESTNKNRVIELCDKNTELLDLVKKENSIPLEYKNAQCKIDFTKFGYSKLNRLIKKHGYKNWKHFTRSIEQFNHKIVKIEKVENRNTGTITIDGTEKWHNYHTFAIDSGIFVKNSINEDYFFPQTAEGRGSKVETLPGGCLAMDTNVSLLDGREMSIKDIEEEMKVGKELWTYSVDPDSGAILPGLISWAGVTHQRAKVMKLTFDNNESVICTPDHKFPVHGKGFLRADELSVDESMMPLYRKKEKISDYKKIDYEQFFDIKTKEWKYTHRTVADYLRDSVVIYNVYDKTVSDGKYDVRHHKDFNRFNNEPNNLVFMSWHDHKLLHQNFGFSKESQELGTLAAKKKMADLKENHPKEYKKIQQRKSESSCLFWSKLSEDEAALQRKKISQGIQKNISQLSKEERKIRNKTSSTNFRKGSDVVQHKLKHDPEFNAWFRRQQSNGWTAEARAKQSENFKIYNTNVKWGKNRELSLTQHRKKQKIDYSINMLNFIADCIKDKTSHQVTLHDVVYMLNNDEGMCEELSKLNSEKKVPNWNISMGFTPSIVKKIPVEFGYSSWIDFRKKKSVHNHRVVAIEYLDEEIEVGTLTIDNDELYHNYHTFALTCGVFTKNSNLGEIDDLRYFTNKLVRGLRIPSSYLPTGAEDSSSQYNDGRVGTAYIQELRFNTYCERLQNLVIPSFDQEFKRYMLEKGVNIDTSMFDLKFQPPQNFASYRQSEIDNARIPTFSQMSAIPYISNRFALKRFLGLSDEEIAENENLWREENEDNLEPTADESSAEMRDAGISGAGIDSDLDSIEDEAPNDAVPDGADAGDDLTNPASNPDENT